MLRRFRNLGPISTLIITLGVVAQQDDPVHEDALAPEQIWEGATFLTTHLDNGLRVSIFADERMPTVTTSLTYLIGSSHEEEDYRGLAHLFEHLMFSGSEKFAERAIFDYVEEFGGTTNATTSFDETDYYALTPPDRFHRILEIYADRMVNLVITETELERDRKIVLEELRANAQNDPINRLSMDALARGMNNHPYSISPLGTEEDVNNVTLDKCLAFYRKYYGPQNAHLVVAGSVDPTETLGLIQQTFGDISKQVEAPPDIPLLSDWTYPDEVVLKDDIPPVEVAAMVYAMPAADSPDYQASNILVSMLNRLDGFEDEIVKKSRRALYAQTVVLNMKAGGVLAFSSVALPYRTKDAAYRYLNETLQKLAEFEWLDDEKLASMKRNYLRGEYRGRYYSSSMASRISFAQDWQGDANLAFDRETQIANVSVEDVKRVYRQYVLEATPVKAYIEPTHVPWYIRAFGRLYPLADRLGLADLFI